jgi:hypothetical protein
MHLNKYIAYTDNNRFLMCLTTAHMLIVIYLIDMKTVKRRDLSIYFSVRLHMHGSKNQLGVYFETI